MSYRLRSKVLFSVLLMAALLMPAPANGQEVSKEYQVKAAFVANFVQFVDWPEQAITGKDKPFVIGIVGDNPFGDVLEKLVLGKQVQGHAISVKMLAASDDLRQAQVLFIGNSLAGKVRDIVAKVAGAPVLTIGDDPGLLAAGGIIHFFLEDNKVRFEVNLQAAEKAQLKFSSKLLRLARIYQP